MIAEQMSHAPLHAFYTNDPQAMLSELNTRTEKGGNRIVIHETWETIPYLPLRENLFLGLSRRQRNQLQFSTYLKLLNFREEILQRPLAALTGFEMLRLQILQQLLRQPEILIFQDVTIRLTIKENQELLYLAGLLSRQLGIEILFITSDHSFAAAVSQMND